MDTSGNLVQNPMPDILNIKPVKDLDLPEKPEKDNVSEEMDIEIEDAGEKDIFVKPETEKPKKKER